MRLQRELSPITPTEAETRLDWAVYSDYARIQTFFFEKRRFLRRQPPPVSISLSIRAQYFNLVRQKIVFFASDGRIGRE